MTYKRVPHPYACEECGRTFLGLAALQAHRCDKRVPRCPKCGYTYEDCRYHGDHHLCGEPEPAPAVSDERAGFATMLAEAAQEIRALRAERDVLRAALREIRSALRKYCIKDNYCDACGSQFIYPGDERHGALCLAAPEDAP